MEKKNIKIFLICGKARHGKDTVAKIIKEKYEMDNLKSITLSYAYYIKDYAKRITNWDGSDDTKPRELLQQLGTNIIRNNIDDKLFIRRMIEDIKVFSYYYDIAIISDGRFKAEIDTIRDEFSDVCVIHVERPDFDNGLTEEQKKHPTEVDLDDYDKYDYKILNDGSISDLENKISDILKEVK